MENTGQQDNNNQAQAEAVEAWKKYLKEQKCFQNHRVQIELAINQALENFYNQFEKVQKDFQKLDIQGAVRDELYNELQKLKIEEENKKKTDSSQGPSQGQFH